MRFWCRMHATDGRMRVWREGWLGDQFEVMEKEEFEQFKGFCGRFGIALYRCLSPLNEHED